MKALNTDAVRKLYRGKYAPAKEEPEVNGSQIRGIILRQAGKHKHHHYGG